MKSLAILCLVLCVFPAFSDICGVDSRTVFSASPPQLLPLAFDSKQAFHRIVNGRPPLPKEDQLALFEKYAQTGDLSVAQEITMHNLHFVLTVASDYSSYYKNDLIDIIHEGVMGLFAAVKKYDLEEEKEFKPFAFQHIRGKMKDYFYDNRRMVRVKINSTQQKTFIGLKQELLLKGKSVFDERERVAEEVGVSVDLIAILDLQLNKNNEMSLEGPPGGEKSGFDSGKITLADTLAEKDGLLASVVSRTDPILKNHLPRFLRRYSQRNRDIFLNFYFASNPLTGVEMARSYNISEGRVTQIRNSMIASLRKYVDSFGLK